MKQMKIPSELVVDFDYKHADTIIQVLKPVVWKDGDSYCCLLGEDPTSGIFGCGDTPEDATEDWQDSLKQFMNSKSANSEVGESIKQTLLEHQKESHSKINEFEAQFMPRKKR